MLHCSHWALKSLVTYKNHALNVVLIFYTIGAMSTMPAVRIFSLYAAAAVFFDFLLQITAFVAILSLDSKRQENNRLDVLCCIKEPKYNSTGDQLTCVYTFMKNYFAEALLSDYVRPVVVRVFYIFCIFFLYLGFLYE